jgi:hypothetical protein
LCKSLSKKFQQKEAKITKVLLQKRTFETLGLLRCVL